MFITKNHKHTNSRQLDTARIISPYRPERQTCHSSAIYMYEICKHVYNLNTIGDFSQVTAIRRCPNSYDWNYHRSFIPNHVTSKFWFQFTIFSRVCFLCPHKGKQTFWTGRTCHKNVWRQPTADDTCLRSEKYDVRYGVRWLRWLFFLQVLTDRCPMFTASQ